MSIDSDTLGAGWTKDDVYEFVSKCFDRDTNLRVLLGFSSTWFTHRMIVVLGKTTVQPFMVRDWDIPERVLRKARVSNEGMSFEAGMHSGKSYTPLFKALEINALETLSVVPIPIGGRITIALIGTNNNKESKTLIEIGHFIGEQLERLILLTKNKDLPAKGERIPPLPTPKDNVDVSNHSLEVFMLDVIEEEELKTKSVEIGSADTNAGVGPTRVDIIPISKNKVLSKNESIEIEIGDELSKPKIGRDTQEKFRKTFTLEDSIVAPPDEVPLGFNELSTPFPIVSEISKSEESNPNATVFGLPLSAQDTPHGLTEDTAGRTSFGSPLVSQKGSGVAIVAPKAIGEEPLSHATLMGGIGVESDLMEKSLRETMTSIAVNEKPKIKRGIPGAAIFRARRKSGKVGGFIPQPTVKKEALHTTLQSKNIETDNEDVHRARVRQTINLSNSEKSELENILESSEDPTNSEDNTKEISSLGIPKDEELKKDTNPNLPPDVIRGMLKKSKNEYNSIHDEWGLADSESDSLDPSIFDDLDSKEISLSEEAMSLLLESGPSAVEYQEHFLLIDSRDKEVAFHAAEEIAALGSSSIKMLSTVFPGRVFIDRYQFTADTMPAAALHTPVLDCLIRIGNKAASVPLEFLDDKSIETRFYAILTLLFLDPGTRISEIYERFFDKDHQIQKIAKKVLHSAEGSSGFFGIIERLRNELEFSQKDNRVEIAADILASMKDFDSIELLIDLLAQQSGRTQARIHSALQKLTLKDWSTPYEWRQWWLDAKNEKSTKWLIEALDSPNENVRKMASDEIKVIPGLELNYQVMQPSKLRRRAQRELRSWFENN